MSTSLWIALIIAIALCCGLLVPYLIEVISRGKIEVGPRMPTGAADTRAGWRGNPDPGHPTRVEPDDEMLSLRSFHIVFISLSIVLAAGTGVWALVNHELLLGAISLAAAILLAVYGNYFLRKVRNARLE
jgi:hypothetical protein